MKEPAGIVEVFLQPGEWYFGDRLTRLRTLLGSCVSITLWHPERLIGGMCHYMLPERAGAGAPLPDGKYANEAFPLLLREIERSGTALHEYEVKMFGGGNMFPSGKSMGAQHIGEKNAAFGKSLLDDHGVRPAATDLGGIGHRTILFDVWSGAVWVRRYSKALPGVCRDCKSRELCYGRDVPQCQEAAHA